MDKPVVEVETTIAAEADKVWEAMTKKSAMFPGTKVETDWKVGHPISFAGEWNGKAFKDYGEIQSITEAKELSFSHWSKTPERPESYHVVRYELEPAGKKTKVKLAQINKGKETAVDDKTKAEFKKNWTTMLDGLKKTAEAA